jgi:5-methylcytosine-specific restriction endonuclease McrA
MRGLKPRHPRIRLHPEDYKALRREVLARDSWRCQNCGSSEDLQAHHIQPRGKLGADSLDNLITLCATCHEALHTSGLRSDQTG